MIPKMLDMFKEAIKQNTVGPKDFHPLGGVSEHSRSTTLDEGHSEALTEKDTTPAIEEQIFSQPKSDHSDQNKKTVKKQKKKLSSVYQIYHKNNIRDV
jgi:hypothetical protein